MSDNLTALLVIAMIIALYFLPSIVARRSRHPQTTAIYVLNALFGWTLIGWGIALIWAFTTTKEST